MARRLTQTVGPVILWSPVAPLLMFRLTGAAAGVAMGILYRLQRFAVAGLAASAIGCTPSSAPASGDHKFGPEGHNGRDLLRISQDLNAARVTFAMPHGAYSLPDHSGFSIGVTPRVPPWTGVSIGFRILKHRSGSHFSHDDPARSVSERASFLISFKADGRSGPDPRELDLPLESSVIDVPGWGETSIEARQLDCSMETITRLDESLRLMRSDPNAPPSAAADFVTEHAVAVSWRHAGADLYLTCERAVRLDRATGSLHCRADMKGKSFGSVMISGTGAAVGDCTSEIANMISAVNYLPHLLQAWRASAAHSGEAR